jgi:hypothetical protein
MVRPGTCYRLTTGELDRAVEGVSRLAGAAPREKAIVSRRRRTKVDERLVPVRRKAVHTVETDGEAVLLDEANGRLHLLNATGALVWVCVDGEASIGEIVTDLSDELGAARAVVLADRLAITRHLGEEGLLANLEPPVLEPTGPCVPKTTHQSKPASSPSGWNPDPSRASV